MKIAATAAERFLKNPDAGVLAVLVYGPDTGLVHERAGVATIATAGDAADPFRVVELTGADLKSDPARLSDEAAALSMIGGRRVVRVRDASDTLSALLKEYLATNAAVAPGDRALVILEAGDLAGRSSLRALMEGDKRAAAIGCYRDGARDLDRLARDDLRAAGLTIGAEALETLTDRLGSDRLVSRREIEKLITYLGGAAREVGVEDVLAVVGDNAALVLDDVALSAFAGDAVALDRALDHAWSDGASPIQILRAAARHAIRLHRARIERDAGASLDNALAILKPRPHFSAVERFKAALDRWSAPRLGQVLARLLEIEIACKRTGAPDGLLTGRTMIEIVRAARRRG